MGHDFCLAFGMFGVGFFVCALRLGVVSRRDRKIAKIYLVRCRAWGLKTQHLAQGSIGNLTLVVSRRVTGRFGRRLLHAERDLIALRHDVEQLQRGAFAEHEAQLRADGRPHVAIHDDEMEDEDREDAEAASEALADYEANGGTPWEDVKAKLGLNGEK